MKSVFGSLGFVAVSMFTARGVAGLVVLSSVYFPNDVRRAMVPGTTVTASCLVPSYMNLSSSGASPFQCT